MDLVTLGLSKKYTEDTVVGLGAIKGAPATISKIEKVDGGNNVTFSWTANDGSKTETQTIFIADGEKGADGPQGPQGPQGEPGKDGGVRTVNGVTPDENGNVDISMLPAQTDADEGKVLRLVNGAPTWSALINAEEVAF